MRTFIGFFLCFLLLSTVNTTFSASSASIHDLGNKQEQLQQLKEKLGAKRYERLMRKIDQKIAKTEAKRRKGMEPGDQAILALVLSVLSLFFFPLAIVGIILGVNAKKRMRETENYQNYGLASAAVIVGGIMIALVILAIGVVLYTLFTFGVD